MKLDPETKGRSKRPPGRSAGQMVRASSLLVVLCAMLAVTSTASAYWYWYTSAGIFAGVGPGDTRNSGAYLGSRGEMTNENFGTRKTLLADALSGADWFDGSADDGDPRGSSRRTTTGP